MSLVLDGRVYAQRLKDLLEKELNELTSIHRPGLAIIQIGKDPASQVYVHAKLKQADAIGISAHHFHFDESVSQSHLLDLIDSLNTDERVHGMIVQFPLPPALDSFKILNRIRPEKDIDGLTLENVGLLAMARPNLIPCTPLGC